MNIKLSLPKSLFFKGFNEKLITLDTPVPNFKKWASRNEIGYDFTGVYVIFDKMGGTDWDKPNQEKLNSKTRNCLYVGEGKILSRLNVHNNHTLIGKYAGEVIYYESFNTLNRKLLERILIKHYVPIFNKEEQYSFDIKKSYMDNTDDYINELIKILDDMQKEVGQPPTGKKIIEHLFNKEDMTLTEIENYLFEIIQGLSTNNNRYYQDKRNWY